MRHEGRRHGAGIDYGAPTPTNYRFCGQEPYHHMGLNLPRKPPKTAELIPSEILNFDRPETVTAPYGYLL